MKNKEKIGLSAIKLFRINPNTSLEEIAKESNVSRSTLHRQFKGKKELIQYVFDQVSKTYLEGLTETILAHSDAKERLLAVFNYDLSTYRDADVLSHIYDDYGVEKLIETKIMMKINQAHQLVFEAIINAGLCPSDIDVHLFRLYYRSQLNFAMRLHRSSDNQDLSNDLVWRIFWIGISKDKTS